MLERILIVLLLAYSSAYGEGLAYGMSEEDVRIELGRPESKMTLGGKEVWIYPDGDRIEFVDGKLTRENDRALIPPSTLSNNVVDTTEPLISAEEMIELREEKTISATINSDEIDYSELAETGGDMESLEGTDAIFEQEETQVHLITLIAVSFAIELVVTLLVLSIAFQISGFTTIFRQLLFLSLAVAIIGAVFDIILQLGPLNPVRSAAGFIILLVLIRQLTDVREWVTAIKIAVIARIVSIVMVWLVMLGATMLFSF